MTIFGKLAEIGAISRPRRSAFCCPTTAKRWYDAGGLGRFVLSIGLLLGVLWVAPNRVVASENSDEFLSRINKISKRYIGKPYVRSPLGEGRGKDEDPRFRTDAFDCTTYVETVVAVSRTSSKRAARRELDSIRYQKGRPSFANRRHFAVSQWIPGMIKEGFAADVTKKVGGDRTKYLLLDIDEEVWETRTIGRGIRLPKKKRPYGSFELPYVPLQVLIDEKLEVPSGAIVSVVRGKRDGYPDAITHQGFVFKAADGTLLLRHASRLKKRVVNTSLQYVLRRWEKKKKWPVLGLHFLLPLSQEQM